MNAMAGEPAGIGFALMGREHLVGAARKNDDAGAGGFGGGRKVGEGRTILRLVAQGAGGGCGPKGDGGHGMAEGDRGNGIFGEKTLLDG